MRKHGPGHQLESSDSNSGALVTAQGGQLSCRTVTEHCLCHSYDLRLTRSTQVWIPATLHP